MTTDIDTRGRRAAAAVREALTDVPRPERPTAGSTRRSSGPRLLVAAAIVVVAGLAALAVVLGGGSDRSGVATDAEGGVPRLVVDRVPEGMEPTGAVDLPLEASQRGPTLDLWVYGAAGAIDPFAADDLGIVRIDLAGASGEFELPDGTPIPVGDRAGVVLRREESIDGRTSVFVEQDDGTVFSTSSASLAEAQLIAVAAQVGLLDGEVVLPANLPAGLEPVATRMGLSGAGLSVPLPVAGRGHLVGYQAEDLGRVLAVSSLAGDDDLLLVLRWLTGVDEPIQIRGSDGWFGDGHFDQATVVWRESAGVVVVVGTGMDRDELLDAAESLRPATDDEWATLAGRVAGGEDHVETGESPATIVGSGEAIATVSGELPDGSTWTVTALADGSVRLNGPDRIERVQGFLSPGGEAAPVVRASLARLATGEVLVYGLASLDVPGPVEIRDEAGGRLPGFSIAYAEWGDAVFAGVFVSDEELPAELVVVEVDSGTEIGRIHTGDAWDAPDLMLPGQ